jgi:hypothetical protein
MNDFTAALGRLFCGQKKPPQPKLKRSILPTLLQVVEAIPQQFKDVLNTYTNHHEIPRMFQKFQHAWPSRRWARPPAHLPDLCAFGITSMLPVRRLS